MKPLVDCKEKNIEFRHITGQDKIEEINQLFLDYTQSLKIDLNFQNFEEEFNTLPGKYWPPDGNNKPILIGYIEI